MAGCRLLQRSNAKAFLDSIDTIMTDCDGVLWNGSVPIEGVPAAVQKLKNLGKKILYVTNNSTRTREEYVRKCESLGYPAEKEDIIGSAFVTAQYLKNVINYEGRIFIVGSSGLQGELSAAGYDTIGAGPQPIESLDELSKCNTESDVKCVVVGFDKDFTYTKLAKALAHISQTGCKFVATNTDSGMPTAGGGVIPGTGTIVAAVETAVGRAPDVICGKPHRPIFDVAMSLHSLNPARTVMIGDRLNTDIELAHNCGLKSLQVLTGFHSLDDAKTFQSSNSLQHQKWVPDYYINSLADLGEYID